LTSKKKKIHFGSGKCNEIVQARRILQMLRMGMLILCLGIVAGSLSFGTNPTSTGYDRADWRVGGEDKFDPTVVPYEIWDPAHDPWCGHFTADGNRYKHAHTTGFYPLWSDDHNMSVTTNSVEAYYDNWFITEEGWTQLAGKEVDLDYNCHGYSMGKLTWVETPGRDTLLQDEYTTCVPSQATLAIYRTPPVDHSALILEKHYNCTTQKYYIKKKRQKMRDSGVYELTVSNPTEEIHVVGSSDPVGYKPQ
jgi:hypothetical protein